MSNWKYLKWDGNLKSPDGWQLIPGVLETVKEFNHVSGVYIIYDDEKTICYIGSTFNLGYRLKKQIKFYLPHHIKIKALEECRELETQLINKLNPVYNTVGTLRGGFNKHSEKEKLEKQQRKIECEERLQQEFNDFFVKLKEKGGLNSFLEQVAP